MLQGNKDNMSSSTANNEHLTVKSILKRINLTF